MFGSFLAPTDDMRKTAHRYIAWIDGVGAWLILTSDCVSFGRGTGGGIGILAPKKKPEDEADIAVMGNLSRKHATLKRAGENYVLTAFGKCAIQGRQFNDEFVVPDRCAFQLNDSVQFGFSVPTPLSGSARVTFESSHRPNLKVDGIVLMSHTCLLGPGRENHIPCPGWRDSIVLAQTSNGIAVKSRNELLVDGQLVQGRTDISAGQIVSGTDFRFRLEEL